MFNLGRLLLAVGWLAVVWLGLTSAVLLLPSRQDPVRGLTWENFNYAPVVAALTLAFATVNWNLPRPYGVKHYFKGPRVGEARVETNEAVDDYEESREEE